MVDVYLERIAADAFKREFDQEENVIRSLPFFAAALALAVTIVAQLVRRFPAFEPNLYALTLHVALAAVGALFLATLAFLVQATRRNAYLYPPDETATLAWTEDVIAAYLGGGMSRPQADELAEAALRQAMTSAFAEAAVHNRAINTRRAQARTTALSLLLGMLTLALAMAAIIFVQRQVSLWRGSEVARGEGLELQGDLERACERFARSTESGPRFGGHASACSTPAARAGRGEVSVSSRAGLRPMSETKTPVQAPPAPTTLVPPPPPMQIVKKNDEAKPDKR